MAIFVINTPSNEQLMANTEMLDEFLSEMINKDNFKQFKINCIEPSRQLPSGDYNFNDTASQIIGPRNAVITVQKCSEKVGLKTNDQEEALNKIKTTLKDAQHIQKEEQNVEKKNDADTDVEQTPSEPDSDKKNYIMICGDDATNYTEKTLKQALSGMTIEEITPIKIIDTNEYKFYSFDKEQKQFVSNDGKTLSKEYTEHLEQRTDMKNYELVAFYASDRENPFKWSMTKHSKEVENIGFMPYNQATIPDFFELVDSSNLVFAVIYSDKKYFESYYYENKLTEIYKKPLEEVQALFDKTTSKFQHLFKDADRNDLRKMVEIMIKVNQLECLLV